MSATPMAFNTGIMHRLSSHIFEHTPETLGAWCAQRAMPSFRAKQILEWVYQKGVTDPAKMTNLSARDRQTLATEMTFLSGDVVSHARATDGVQKLLVQWWDNDHGGGTASGVGTQDAAALAGSEPDAQTGITAPPLAEDEELTIALTQLGSQAPAGLLPSGVAPDSSRQTECVMIPVESDEQSRRTACISSQVGCPVGCKFCASGLGGLEGNLSAGRIVEQVYRLGQLPGVGRISNVVFMGMGEPLSNFAPVTAAIRTICSLWALGISARKVTISTVGLPKAIDRLALELDLPVTLALSLHAPTDEIRRALIPWAEYTTIDELLSSCQRWFRKTGREITLEYTLLRDINDRREHAEELARLAKTLRANINLIRYNEVRGMPFNRPRTDDVVRFQRVLQERGVNTHIRASRGRDIAAACGQLRHESGPKAGSNA
ncbi:MAG: 23S rRNA (adenine(2503)-C(2))-methyltransferase RlmN [Phycisphaerales bacterium]|nr:23S rRNA (adenine(2503)-C(2))-methyltransferase RlmN [Phycisphaerales bacterium]